MYGCVCSSLYSLVKDTLVEVNRSGTLLIWSTVVHLVYCSSFDLHNFINALK